MIKSNIVTGSDFNGVPLLPYEGPNAGYYSKILNIVKDRMVDSFNNSSQVLVVRMVLRLPHEAQAYDNECIQYFIEEYRRVLGSKLIHYVWAREQNSSHNPHWHLILYFNGNRMRYFGSMHQVNRIWGIALGYSCQYFHSSNGLIHICGAGINGIQIPRGILAHRNNYTLINEILKLCSYICKVNSKGNAPKNVNEYGSSQLSISASNIGSVS